MRAAGGELGDLPLHAPQALHLVLESARDLSILTGQLDTMLAYGVAGDRDRGSDPPKGEVGNSLGIPRDALHHLGIPVLERPLKVRDRRTFTLVQTTCDRRLELLV